MPKSLASILHHLIFSTKGRRPCLTSDIAPQLEAYMAGVLRGLGCKVLAVGTANDHAHCGYQSPPTLTTAMIAHDLKIASNRWLRERGGALRNFKWQCGYSVWSWSYGDRAKLKKYILGQRKKHGS